MNPKRKALVTKRSQHCSSILISTAILLGGCSLSFSNWEYRKAESAVENAEYQEAVKHYSRVVLRQPESPIALESARKASRIALFQLKDFNKAIELFRHLVQFSPDSEERLSSQRKIADVMFEKKTDYQTAIVEYNKLLALKLPNRDYLDIKLRIAKAYYYMSEFFQAESEVKNALIKAEKGRQRFDLELFLASIYFNTKRLDMAIEAYKKLDQEYPEHARQEKVKMSLVVCYEETERFEDAISLLNKMKSGAEDPEFLVLKIARLKERIRNLPGSRGLRK